MLEAKRRGDATAQWLREKNQTAKIARDVKRCDCAPVVTKFRAILTAVDGSSINDTSRTFVLYGDASRRPRKWRARMRHCVWRLAGVKICGNGAGAARMGVPH